ncbi:MAG: tetratricopeptide repeat protein [Okeania sp. SIO3I5]|uniref:tetratricopeptide repeat protein n=1 Tax=Okeania sp. SIO3I5 TaxID=2607805 RepID=UPI0013B89648|nr:tetratricopeptide repeat protein [Okeania sp. SIO3I5]NEQ39274.1 tetratricopeptide repeat protein [Okeania sp. SIO3I5]
MLVNRTLLGRYRITDFLGEGGFGETYLAVDMALPGHPQCVVKRLKKNPHPEALEIARRLFDGEAKTLYELGQQDQIPQLLAHFDEDGEFYLVQEFIKGHDLTKEIIPGKRLDESSVIQLLKEILEVLEYVHNNNIIHRDIKPSNLMRRESDNKLVMIDFGAVKELSVLSINKQGKTAPTIAVGTRVYMALEQANGFPKRCSDIYAIGILAIQAITGLYPQEIQKDHTGEIIGWENFQISRKLVNVLKKMVRYKYKERYKNATEVLQAMVGISSKQRKFPVKVIIGSVLTAIAGISLFTIIKNQNPQPDFVGYTTDIQKVMSGRPMLNSRGQVIGINGIFQALSFSRSFPSDNAVAATVKKLSPEAIAQLVEKVDGIAQQISVLITRENLENASGVIIAKQGNTYYVLTAGNATTGEGLKIVTHDGQEYVVDANKVKNWRNQGLDLALLKFTSNKSYQVATIGNDPRGRKKRVVFLSGWPALKQPTAANLESDRRFNAGYLLGMNEYHSFRFLAYGFGLVYGNLSEKGMSGGPVLDIEGRLIGINTTVESVEGDISRILPDDTQEPVLNVDYSLGIPIDNFLAKLEQEKIKLNFNEENSLPQQLDPVDQDLVISSLINLQQPESNATAVEWLNYGNKLWRLRQYEKSLQAFEKAISIKPDFYLAWYFHGLTLGSQENYPEAIKSLTKAIKYGSNLPESPYQYWALSQAWDEKSAAHLNLEQYKESLAAIEKAIEYMPDDFILYQQKSIILLGLGLFPEAREAASTAVKIKPENSVGYILRAVASVITTAEDVKEFTKGEKDNAAAFAKLIAPLFPGINKALELEPGNAIYYMLRGVLYFGTGEKQKGIADLDKAISFHPESADYYFLRGQFFLGVGEKQKGMADLDKTIELEPDDAVYYKNRGDAYFEIGEKQKGIKDYDKAISLDPDSAHKYYNSRGDLFYEQEDYVAAVADYNKAIELKPDDASYYEDRGDAYFEIGEKQKGIEDYDKAISLDPESAYKYYNWRGDWLYEEEDYVAAVADYSKAIELKPDDASYYKNRGNAYFEIGEKQKGIEDYEKAISLDSESAHKYYNWRGNKLYSQRDYEAAIADYNKAIELKSGHAVYYKNRGNAYFEIGEKQKGIKDYDKAISLDSKSAHKYYNWRGNKLYSQRDYEVAIADYNKAIELKSGHAVYYKNRGNAYFEIGEKQKGIKDYDKAISLDSKSAHKYYNWRGNKLYSQRDYEVAIADYNKAIELKPDGALYYQNRGNTYFQIGAKQKGIEDYDKAISLDSDSAHKYYNLRGDWLYKQKDYVAALADFNKAIELKPDRALYYSNRGATYMKVGEKQKGIEDYDKAISLDPDSAHKYYNWRGNKLYSQRDYEAAIADFNKAIELKPDDASYYEDRGDAYFEIGEKQKGIKDYDKAISLDPESAYKYYNWRGVKLYRLEDYEAAIADYNKAIELKPDRALYYKNRGNAYFEIGAKQKGIKNYDKAISLDSESAHKYYNWRGNKLYSQRDYEAAIADYNKAIELKPDRALYYENRGDAYFKIGEKQKGIKDYDKAISLDPDSADKYYNSRGKQLYDLGDYEAALADINKVIESKPDHALFYENRGSAYFQIGEKQKGIKDYEKAISLDPESADYYYNSRGEWLYRLEDSEAAIADYNKAIELKPDRALYYSNRGDAYFQIGEKQKGIKDYDKAISLDPESAHKYYNWRGWWLHILEDSEAALADINKAIELKPDRAFYYKNRGNAYFQIGEKQKGIKDYDKAISLDPESADYYNWRGVKLYRLEDYEAAIADYNKAIELKPDRAFYYKNRGNAYFQIGEKQKGIKDYDKAISLDPESADYYYNWRGVKLYGLEDYEAAIADYNKAIELKPDDASYYQNRGNAYFEIGAKQKGTENEGLGDYEAAIKDYTLGLRKGSEGGIGVNLNKTKLRGKLGWQIKEVYKNYPAFKADLKTGDIILEADGKLLLSDNSDTLSSFLDNDTKGEVGTEVTLKILRGTEEFTVTVIRDLLNQTQVAELHYQRGLAYLQIGSNQKAREDFQKAATLYQQQENTEEYQKAMEQLEKIQEQ